MDFVACWLAFYKKLLGGTQKTFRQGGSTLMSNPQPLHSNLLFILYHITIFLFIS